MGVKYKIEGNGYVVSQSVKESEKVTNDDVVVLGLKR